MNPRYPWLVWVCACAGGSEAVAPVPDTPAAGAVARPSAAAPAAPPDPATTPFGVDIPRVPAGATVVPASAVCPDDHAPYGCFIQVAAATFAAGAQALDASSPGYDPSAAPSEGPVHDVTLSTFWIHRNEVTVDQYTSCVEAGACPKDDVLTDPPLATFGGAERDVPIVGVTFDGAVRYCGWVGARLPTEFEFELAARSPAGRRFAHGARQACADGTRSGDDQNRTLMSECQPAMEKIIAHLGQEKATSLFERLGIGLEPALLIERCRRDGAADVASLVAGLEGLLASPPAPPPATLTCDALGVRKVDDVRLYTPDGIAGLAGNVAEWTSDAFAPYPGGPPLADVAAGARVLRGGSWMSETVSEWRGAARAGAAPGLKLPDVGFRCAWSPPR